MAKLPLGTATRGSSALLSSRFAVFWICLASVSYLALAPQDFVIDPGASDKVHHVFAFATLGVLGAAAWPPATRSVLLCLLAYGCLIEMLQGFTDTRFAEVLDVVADAVGVGVAALLLKLARIVRVALSR